MKRVGWTVGTVGLLLLATVVLRADSWVWTDSLVQNARQNYGRVDRRADSDHRGGMELAAPAAARCAGHARGDCTSTGTGVVTGVAWLQYRTVKRRQPAGLRGRGADTQLHAALDSPARCSQGDGRA